ncbi:hypothetical protein FZC76_05865 [Sutcliffiella horikoshii]|uniref:Uncharacterized protein n=1 Tax=Sutcliffiella horikoshii TaxID=79883 RepID=A0A5D4T396_9BACI|nr:hypothetical protein [Sutcliffiella horikoshii]TYS69759.1 hypothetical protein FZC76_05865 [Sutcliffiella horikoshii]
MDKVIKFLYGSITELNKLDNELKILDEEELLLISATYPFHDYFHEVVSKLNTWKEEIEKNRDSS